MYENACSSVAAAQTWYFRNVGGDNYQLVNQRNGRRQAMNVSRMNDGNSHAFYILWHVSAAQLIRLGPRHEPGRRQCPVVASVEGGYRTGQEDQVTYKIVYYVIADPSLVENPQLILDELTKRKCQTSTRL